MYNKQLFPKGISLNDTTSFKVLTVDGEITQLATYQSSLIELIQGFALHTNERVEVNSQYNGWVTDKPDPIYDGLEILKMFMLNADQLDEYTTLKDEKYKKEKAKEDKQREKRLKIWTKKTKKTKKKIKKQEKELSNITGQYHKYIDLLKEGKTDEELKKNTNRSLWRRKRVKNNRNSVGVTNIYSEENKPSILCLLGLFLC